MQPPLIVVARLRARPDRVAELRAALDTLTVATRAEDGCLVYDLHVAADDPTLFVFHERWESRAHHQAHDATDHVATFRASATDLLAEEPSVDLLYGVEPAPR